MLINIRIMSTFTIIIIVMFYIFYMFHIHKAKHSNLIDDL